MDKISAMRRLVVGLGASAVLVGMFAGPAFAADTVTQTIIGGGLTASVMGTFAPVDYSNTTHMVTGNMTLTADDATDSAAGWNVTIESSDFTSTGAAPNTFPAKARSFLRSKPGVDRPSSHAHAGLRHRNADQSALHPRQSHRHDLLRRRRWMTALAGDAVPQPTGPAAGEFWAYRVRRQDPLVQVAVVRLGVKTPQRILVRFVDDEWVTLRSGSRHSAS
jgi:hypothetical protein